MISLEKPLPYTPLDNSVEEFQRWKQSRKKCINILGCHLIPLSNDNINLIFSKWESIARSCIKSKSSSSIMIGLYHLSMLFYFNRSLTKIDDLIPKISQCIFHKSRCLCRTASRVLLYISKDSPENINFFHDFFTKSWMTIEQNAPYLYSTLVILNDANSIVASAVRSLVTPQFDSILKLAFSDDLEIQDAVMPIISHHFSMTADQLSKFTLFSICVSNLTHKPTPVNRGSLYLIKMLIRLKLTQEQIILIISKLSNNFLNFQNENILLLCFEILILIFEQKEGVPINEGLMHFLTISLIGCLKRFPESKELLNYFYKIISLVPNSLYPESDILDFASFIFTSYIRFSHSCGYYLVYITFLRFPCLAINFKIPYDSTFCKHFLKLLKMKPSLIIEHQKKLNQFFEDGVSANSSQEQIKLKLKVARACGPLLWGSTQNLVDHIKGLHFSQSEKIRKEAIKIIGQFDDQANIVISQALFDPSPKVRLVSLRFLKKADKVLIKDALIPTLLADRSFQVTSEALSLISRLSLENPMLFITPLYSFYKTCIQNYLRGPTLSESSVVSNLFPELAKTFVKIDKDLSKALASFSVFVLMRGNDDGVFFDMYINKEILNPFNSSEKSLKAVIFRLVHLPYLDTCDINFLKTLEILKDYVKTDHLSKMFSSFVIERRSKVVILASLHTLTCFVPYLKFEYGYAMPFFDLLNEMSSHKVAVAIFEFFGTAGISYTPELSENTLKNQRNSIIDYSNNIVRVWLFESLVSVVPNQLQSFFEATTNAIILYPKLAPKFLGKLIPEYVHNLSVRQNDTIVNQLISITKEMKNYMVPYLDILQPILLERLYDEQCVRLCWVLSCALLNNFIPYGGVIFHRAVNVASSDVEKPLLKQILKFMSFSVIFQNQPIDVLLKVHEKVCEKVPEIVITELIRILQNSAVTFGVFWITRIFFKIREHPFAMQLIYSVALFGGVSFNLLSSIIDRCGIIDENFGQLETKSDRLPSFVVTVSAKLKQEAIARRDFDIDNLFSSLAPPVNNNIDQWVQEFVNLVVSNSPNRGIRCCRDLANQSSEFRNSIIAPAFMTCWVPTPEYQQEEFLGVFRYIVENYQPLPEILFKLIDLQESCRMGFPIPFYDLAKAAHFPAQSLHYWKCYFRQSPNDVESYIEQCLKMGLLDTARGILHSAQINKNIHNIEKWSERLGDWSAALKQYKTKGNIPGQIRCYGHLENWIRILKLEPLFVKMNEVDKAETSIWFGWSFYFEKDITKAEYFLDFFPENESQAHFYLRCFILIKKREFEKAELLIRTEQNYMAGDHSMFDGTNTKLAEEKLNLAQHLIELLEVIKALKNNIDQKCDEKSPIMWKLRQPLEERTNDCKELTNIRSLLFSEEMQLQTVLKMASSLRKGRSSESFKGAYFRLIKIKRAPEVIFEGIKMLWAIEQKNTAILFLDMIIGCYENRNKDWVMRKLGKVQKSSLKYLEYFSGDFYSSTSEFAKGSPVSKTKLAQLKRVLINWKLQEKSQTTKRLFKYQQTLKKVIEIRPKDIKTLFVFSLINVRILDDINNDTNIIALDAAANFLNVIELSSSDNLSALLLLLSLLSRCGNDFIMNKSNIEKLKNLPQSLVSKSLPQLVNLLSHSCERLRNTVKYILLNFGTKRFQKLYFAINIGMLSSNETRSKFSREIFNTLRLKHANLADDLILFTESMNRSAVSLLEEWKYGIEAACRLYENDEGEKAMLKIRQLLDRLVNPTCDLDKTFGKIITNQLLANNFYEIFAKIESGDINIVSSMWNKLYLTFEQISQKVDQLAMISLMSVAEKLVNKGRDLLVAVPGTHDNARIVLFDPILQVFHTAYRPRFLSMTDEFGKKHSFLLKGNCDVRIDYRIMQFLLLINSFLCSNRSTIALSATQYSIVPISKKSGLISWVNNSESLHQIMDQFPNNRAKEAEIIRTNFQYSTSTMSSPQLLELYQMISDNTDANELDQFIWLKAPTSANWLKNCYTFVTSSALMSIAGYLIGLGDRHPNNVLLQVNTGKIAHIDFGEIFEVTLNRSVYPEKVPFRLTRMIVNALDGGNPHGVFKKTCEDVLSLLRESKQTIIAQFDLFTTDSAISFSPKFQGARIKERVKEKLDGRDELICGNAPSASQKGTLSVEEQVDALIEIAGDAQRYATQFIGWCAYW